jgi:hypothetical protein
MPVPPTAALGTEASFNAHYPLLVDAAMRERRKAPIGGAGGGTDAATPLPPPTVAVFGAGGGEGEAGLMTNVATTPSLRAGSMFVGDSLRAAGGSGAGGPVDARRGSGGGAAGAVASPLTAAGGAGGPTSLSAVPRSVVSRKAAALLGVANGAGPDDVAPGAVLASPLPSRPAPPPPPAFASLPLPAPAPAPAPAVALSSPPPGSGGLSSPLPPHLKNPRSSGASPVGGASAAAAVIAAVALSRQRGAGVAGRGGAV